MKSAIFFTALRGVLVAFSMAAVLAGCAPDDKPGQARQHTLLNVSYDVSRDFYEHINPLFAADYAQQHPGSSVRIQQSHGGASKQALAVANGLQADVVTLNQTPDMVMLVQKGLVRADWPEALPNHASPYSSVMVLLVRRGNPKGIHDWADLTRPGVQSIIANPKTSGTARYGVLSAYQAALQQANGNADAAKAWLAQWFKQIPVLDSGARAASNTFIQRQIGDVLITTENEAALAAHKFSADGFSVVYPKTSVVIDNPVAVVAPVAEKKGNTELAQAYLRFLWSDAAQQAAAEAYLRPANAAIRQQYASRFPAVDAWSVTQEYGSWDQVMHTFFADGALLDQVLAP